jgi:hypothetical protein
VIVRRLLPLSFVVALVAAACGGARINRATATAAPRLAVVRANLLFEVEPNEAKTLVSKGWRFWLRRAQVSGEV